MKRFTEMPDEDFAKLIGSDRDFIEELRKLQGDDQTAVALAIVKARQDKHQTISDRKIH